jgi:hypothetical protein
LAVGRGPDTFSSSRTGSDAEVKMSEPKKTPMTPEAAERIRRDGHDPAFQRRAEEAAREPKAPPKK